MSAAADLDLVGVLGVERFFCSGTTWSSMREERLARAVDLRAGALVAHEESGEEEDELDVHVSRLRTPMATTAATAGSVMSILSSCIMGLRGEGAGGDAMRASARGDGRVGKRKSPLAQNHRAHAAGRDAPVGDLDAARTSRRTRRRARSACDRGSLADPRAADAPGLDTGAPRGCRLAHLRCWHPRMKKADYLDPSPVRWRARGRRMRIGRLPREGERADAVRAGFEPRRLSL